MRGHVVSDTYAGIYNGGAVMIFYGDKPSVHIDTCHLLGMAQKEDEEMGMIRYAVDNWSGG